MPYPYKRQDSTASVSEDAEADFKAANLARSSAPALVLLAPACLGFIAAGIFEFPKTARAAELFALLFFSGIFLSAVFYRARTRRAAIIRAWTKKISIFGLVFFAAIMRFGMGDKTAGGADPFPAAEAAARLRIISATPTSYGGVCGRAVIEDIVLDPGPDYGCNLSIADSECERFKGTKVWYNFYNDRKRTQKIALTPSESVQAFGAICPPAKDKDSFSRYLYYNGFSGTFSAYIANCKAVSPPDGMRGFFAEAAGYVNKVLSKSYFSSNPEIATANKTYRAMILGDKSLLGREAKDIYSKTGVMHIFAVSGLHIATFALALAFVLRLIRIPWRWSLLVCAPCVFFYAGICSFPPSAMRAAAMITFVWGLCALMRKPKTLAALVLSALVFLSIWPRQVFDAGFALSYCAVAAIIIYGVPLSEFLSEKMRPFKLLPESAMGPAGKLAARLSDTLWGGFAIAFAASFASAPLTLYFFGICAPFAVFYSVVYVIGASFCVCCALAAMLIAPLAKIPNTAAELVSLALDRAAEFINSLNLCVEADIKSYIAAIAAEAAFLATAQILASNGAGKRAFFIIPPVAGACATFAACLF